MSLYQVKQEVIQNLAKMVKECATHQRDIVLSVSNDLVAHNKLIRQALAREEKMIGRLNRIEEKLMQKEMYNYQ